MNIHPNKRDVTEKILKINKRVGGLFCTVMYTLITPCRKDFPAKLLNVATFLFGSINYIECLSILRTNKKSTWRLDIR